MTAAAWGRSDRLVAGGRQERTFGVAWTTADRWAKRYAAEGRAGMADRSSRPHFSPGNSRHRNPLMRHAFVHVVRDDHIRVAYARSATTRPVRPPPPCCAGRPPGSPPAA